MEFSNLDCIRLLRSTKITHKCFIFDTRSMTRLLPKALPCRLNNIGNSEIGYNSRNRACAIYGYLVPLPETIRQPFTKLKSFSFI